MSQGRLRILHLVMLRFWSAIAWHAVTMAQALSTRGHTCFLAGVPGSPVMREAHQAHHVPAGTLPLGRLRPWNWPAAIVRLRTFVRTRGVEAIFVHTGSGHLEAHLARCGLPVALLRVRADARAPRGDAGHRWLYARATDRILASGAFMAERFFADWQFPAQHLQHLPPGIDVAGLPAAEEARDVIRERYRLPPDLPLIGIIGRLSPVKGHADLLAAAARLARAGREFRLLIVGEEQEVSRASLLAAAHAGGIADRVLCTGFVDDPLLHAAALDVGVIPSLGSEAVSRSALEFMAVSVPVVAARVGILPEVVARDELLVPPGEPAALAAALERLLADPAARRRWAAAGQARVCRHYSLDQLGAGAERATREALDRRSGVAP